MTKPQVKPSAGRATGSGGVDRRKSWITKWKKKKEGGGKEAAKEVLKKATAKVKDIRRALKKARTFEARKTVRKLAGLSDAAAGEAEKRAKLERQLAALKGANLDLALLRALQSVDRLPPALLKLPAASKTGGGAGNGGKGSGREGFSDDGSEDDGGGLARAQGAALTEQERDETSGQLLKCPPVVQQLRELSILLDPELRPKTQAQALPADVEAVQEEEAEEADREDDFDPDKDDVAMKLAGIKTKNRPGQRTRRKLILQKYGKEAKVFKEARERKAAARNGALSQEPQAAFVAAALHGHGGGAGGGEGKRKGGGVEDGEEMHPSWVAKKKQAAAIAAALAGGGGAGRKKILDEDDDVERDPKQDSVGGKRGVKGAWTEGRAGVLGAKPPRVDSAGVGGSHGRAGGRGGREAGGKGAGEHKNGQGKRERRAETKDAKNLHPSWAARQQAKEVSLRT